LSSWRQIHKQRTLDMVRTWTNLVIYNGDSSATVTSKVAEGLCAVYSLALNMKLVDDACTIERVTTLSQRYQLQSQYRPEQAM